MQLLKIVRLIKMHIVKIWIIFFYLNFCIQSRAGELFFSERGIRPLGRGGAFIAGADDLNAIWLNSAGLSYINFDNYVLLTDVALMNSEIIYTRENNIIWQTGETTLKFYPSIVGKYKPLPLPMIAVATHYLNNKLTCAIGSFTFYALLLDFPQSVNGEPAPQRYSLLSLNDSLMFENGLWFSYKFSDKLAIGIGFLVLVGRYKVKIAFSAAGPNAVFDNREAYDYDIIGEFDTKYFIKPSANLGIIYNLHENIKLGLSYQLPTIIDSNLNVFLQMPENALFKNVTQNGNKGFMMLKLPWILRLGIEYSFNNWHNEIAYELEGWSIAQNLVFKPDDIYLDNIPVLGSYKIPEFILPRKRNNSYSIRLGSEKKIIIYDNDVSLRGGIVFEKSAIPREYVNVFGLDTNKVQLSSGISWFLKNKNLRLDFLYSYIIAKKIHVSPNEARVPIIDPLSTNSEIENNKYYINAGTYSFFSQIFGVGVEIKL